MGQINRGTIFLRKRNREITFDPIQRIIFKEFAKTKFLSKRFYFTGGTALSAIYLHHRESEDLDFFSENDFDNDLIIEFIKHVSVILKLDYKVTLRERVRIFEFLKRGKFIIKVDFGFYPHKRINKGKKLEGVDVDSLADIGANKITTILQRNAVKDFVDLYFLLQKYTIWDLLHFAQRKFGMEIDLVWLASGFLKAKQFENLPKMLVPLDLSKLKEFYKDLAKKLGSSVVKK